MDYIHESERRGHVWHQGPFWFMANANLTTALTGVLGASLGLDLAASIAAIVLGSALGTFFSAFHAVQGPRLGLPQMIQSRVQFGSRGAAVPLLVVVFSVLGFCVFYAILGSDSLGSISTPHPDIYESAILAVGCVVAIVGHDLIHKVQRWLSYLILANFVLLTAAVRYEAPLGSILHGGSFTWSAFLAQFGASAGYQIAIAPIVSDYTRYLRRDVRSRSVVAAVFAGSMGSAVWLELLGAVALTAMPHGDTVGTLQHYGNQVVTELGSATLALTVPAVIAIIAVSLYSAMISSPSIVDAFRPLRSSGRLRTLWLVALAAVVFAAVHALGGADISAMVGLPTAAASYLLLMRGADLLPERHAIERDTERLSHSGAIAGAGDLVEAPAR